MLAQFAVIPQLNTLLTFVVWSAVIFVAQPARVLPLSKTGNGCFIAFSAFATFVAKGGRVITFMTYKVPAFIPLPFRDFISVVIEFLRITGLNCVTFFRDYVNKGFNSFLLMTAGVSLCSTTEAGDTSTPNDVFAGSRGADIFVGSSGDDVFVGGGGGDYSNSGGCCDYGTGGQIKLYTIQGFDWLEDMKHAVGKVKNCLCGELPYRHQIWDFVINLRYVSISERKIIFSMLLDLVHIDDELERQNWFAFICQQVGTAFGSIQGFDNLEDASNVFDNEDLEVISVLMEDFPSLNHGLLKEKECSYPFKAVA